MYTELTDNQLWKLCKDHSDKMAFAELYDRFARKLYAVAYNRVRNVHACEDIVQDVLMTLWANRKRTEIKSLGGYLTNAVIYACFDYMKSGNRIQLYEAETLPEHASVTNQEDILHIKRLFELLKDETDRLPTQSKLIFRYRQYEGLSVSEIAEKMDLSPRTVENVLYRTILRLRKALRLTILFFSPPL